MVLKVKDPNKLEENPVYMTQYNTSNEMEEDFAK